MRFIFSLPLTAILLFSLRLTAMVAEEEGCMKRSQRNEQLSSAEATARNRRLYDPGEMDVNDFFANNQEQTSEDDSINFHQEVLFQKWREAEETALFWKTKRENFIFQKSILLDEEITSIIKEADHACAYWKKVSYECSNFIQKNQKTDMAYQGQIFDLITAADETASEAQRTGELLQKNSTSLSTDPIGQVTEKNTILTENAIEAPKIQAQSRNSKSFSRPFNLPARVIEGGYLFPDRGNRTFNGLKYTEHALERMAPATPEIIQLLRSRALEKAKSEGLDFGEAKFHDEDPLKLLGDYPYSLITWWYQKGPNLRAILPSTVEAEIANPGSTDLKVITNPAGLVITVMRKNSLQNPPNPPSLLTLKSSVNYSPLRLVMLHLMSISYSQLQPKILPNAKNQLTKNKLLLLKLRYFNLTAPSSYLSPSPFESMSFAAHEAIKKQRSRLFKNIDAIKTLERKRERDSRLRGLPSDYFDDAYFKSISEIDQNRSLTTSEKFSTSLFPLENVLKNIRKIALKSAKVVLRKKLLSRSNFETETLIIRGSSHPPSNLKEQKTLLKKSSAMQETTEKETPNTQKQKKELAKKNKQSKQKKKTVKAN